MPTTAPAASADEDGRVPLQQLSDEAIARIRQQYGDGEPVARIKRVHNVGDHTLYRCLDGDIPGRPRLPPIRRRRIGTGGPAGVDARRAMIAKLWRTAKRQISEVDARLRVAAQQPSERENDLRKLAMLVKTVRDLAALDEAQADTRRNDAMDPVDDDPVPRDIDEFRRELARRMDAFVERRTGTRISD